MPRQMYTGRYDRARTSTDTTMLKRHNQAKSPVITMNLFNETDRNGRKMIQAKIVFWLLDIPITEI